MGLNMRDFRPGLDLFFLLFAFSGFTKMPKKTHPRVAVLVDTATGWGRRLVHGVLSYSTKKDGWHVWVEPRGQEERLRLPPGWDGDGIIARISNPSMAEHLLDRGPVVNISSVQVRNADFPSVTSDVKSGVSLAIDHFLDRGLLKFGYCSLVDRAYVDFHRRAYAEELERRGYDCHVYTPEKNCGVRAPWEKQHRSLTNWLQSLPKPIGLLSWATRTGIELINACDDVGILVPDEVAVIGGDEDGLLCEACRPALSAIHVASEQIGHDAAALLDQLMAGKSPPENPRPIKPTGIVARRSTDLLAIDDPDLVSAIRYIRDNPEKMLQVEDVARQACVSRRSLERKFMALLGRTIHDEIARSHLEKSVDLLARTDMTIPAVADASGYGSPEYFATVFKQKMGTTPLKYRARLRGR